MEKPGILNNFYMISRKTLILPKKNLTYRYKSCHLQKKIFIKKQIKVSLQYLFNVFILFNAIFYL